MEISSGTPTQIAQAGIVETVTDVLTGAVRYRHPGLFLWNFQDPGDRANDIDVLQLNVTAGIVDSVALALFDNGQDGIDRVVGVQPRSHVAAVAMQDRR